MLAVIFLMHSTHTSIIWALGKIVLCIFFEYFYTITVYFNVGCLANNIIKGSLEKMPNAISRLREYSEGTYNVASFFLGLGKDRLQSKLMIELSKTQWINIFEER